MPLLAKKLDTAKHIYYSQGFAGISSVVKQKLSDFEQWFRTTELFHWYLGKGIELRGDMVRIDGLSFSVNNPAISTRMKRHFLSDQYEKPERTAIKQFLNADLPVVEFGGAIGVVACHANKMLRNPQHHVVIEANPDLLPLLEANRDRNGCRFTVLHRAIAYGSDEITFNINQDFWASNLGYSTNRSLRVPTISLQEIVKQFGFERCSLICDIEGAEIALVQHEAETIQRKVATLIIEVHPWCVQADIIDAMLHKLESIGFACVFRTSDNYVLHNRDCH